AIMTIRVLNASTNEEYDTSLFNITWQDDLNAGFSRTVPVYQYTSTTYYFSVEYIGASGETCCRDEGNITISLNRNPRIKCQGRPSPEPPDNPDCPKLIVNEFNGTKDKTIGQYVELLAICPDDCGGNLDISGFIIDDNNGAAIKGNELITKANMQAIGINKGYLMFTNHPNWKAIPNGSLILIYEEGMDKNGGFPSEDTTDIKKDGV
ncbi:MAG: hypothetical protein HRU40_22315, partial [Saprospiraceae bacterium]|nr:hypothetical protein [Saprospiraceae bacterium]